MEDASTMLPPQAPSFWTHTAATPPFDPLAGDLATEVAIVGAGIVGVTLALLLQARGHRVALLEARRVGQQVSGFTTAKVTSLHGRPYARLVHRFGRATARLYGESHEAALEWMVDVVARLRLDCNLRRADAYTYTESADGVAALREEAEIAAQLGLPASFVLECPLPFPIRGAVRFEGQAQFHPLRYLAGLAGHCAEGGVVVAEGTRATDVDESDGECRVEYERGTVVAEHVVVATNLPFVNRGGHFAKTYPRAHVAAAAPCPWDATRLATGMYLADASPTRSVRVEHEGANAWLIATGGGFKTGQGDPVAEMDGLVGWLEERFGATDVPFRWVNEDFHADDGLPYIGRLASDSKRVWTATGLNAWGMTRGTLAALILADQIEGKAHPYGAIYDATRIDPVHAAREFVVQNANVAKTFLKGHVEKGARRGPADLAVGEAAILDRDGGKVAAFRDDEGALHCVDATCTHMGCSVAWNAVSRTWDCPCHGSRFTVDGEVLYGPAVKPLAAR